MLPPQPRLSPYHWSILLAGWPSGTSLAGLEASTA